MSHTMSHPPPSHPVISERSNSLGLAGFICSLVGLVSCGLLSPIGAVLSLIGLGRPPRGLAIAGLVIGLVGSAWVLVAIFVIGVGTVFAALGWKHFRATGEMVAINMAVERYRESKGVYPPSLDALPEAPTLELTDPWGRPYRFQTDSAGAGFSLSSDGPDGSAGTADDVVVHGASVEVTVPAPAGK